MPGDLDVVSSGGKSMMDGDFSDFAWIFMGFCVFYMAYGFYGGFLWFSYIFLFFCFLWLAKKKADTDVSAMFHGSMRFESKVKVSMMFVWWISSSLGPAGG